MDRKRRRWHLRPGVMLPVVVSVLLVGTFTVTLYMMHHSLELQESHGGAFFDQLSSSSAREEDALASTATSTPRRYKYLIFSGFMSGQGLGNAMNGLLATHLLGLEFNRTVCVKPDASGIKDFHAVFAAVPEVEKACNILWKENRTYYGRTFSLNNFGEVPNECSLQRYLASNETVYRIWGNTYPRWPVVPRRFFTTYYRPKQRLIPWLPKPPPMTVVHLRAPDKTNDNRNGLDDLFLENLNKLLGHGYDDTYLVTNQVDLYSKFPHWRSPNWKDVQHSMSKPKSVTDSVHNNISDNQQDPLPPPIQSLQMWSDWYTIATARKVIHTISDFSGSALHWMSNDSTEISVDNNHQLRLLNESWIRDGETPRLVDRRRNASPNGDLRKCLRTETGAWG